MHQISSIRNHFYNREAFSLVELIVVIGIIGVLAGLAFPVVEVLREKGKETACANNMRQWGAAMGMYLDEKRGVFPSDGTSGDEGRAWYNVLPQYIGADPFSVLKANGKAPCPGMGKSLYICPSQRIEPELLANYTGASQTSFALSYAMNYWINAAKKDVSLSTPMRLSQVKHADLFVVFSESLNKSSKTVDASSANFRHRGRVNIVFVDGHVAPVLRASISDVQWDPHFEPGMAPALGAAGEE